MLRILSCLFMLLALFVDGQETLFLRDHLKSAMIGDFLVAAQNKNYTLLHIYNRNQETLIIEEITIPMARIKLANTSWQDWVMKGAPGNTSWIIYALNIESATPQKYYSVNRGNWFQMPERENFLATLLNLQLERLSYKERKKVGLALIPNAESRQVWNPKLVMNGQEVPGALFDAWRTRWPQDGTELAGKMIEVYTPQDPSYPSYFPYWLQISGIIGNAKVRIIDSGSRLHSPAPVVFEL